MRIHCMVAGRGIAMAAALILGSGLGSPAARAGQSACVGDCGGDGMVTIGDLIIGVNIALGQRQLADCTALDADDSGALTIDELVRAVGNALTNCAGGTVAQGLEALAAGNLAAARNAFALAAGGAPDDGAAQLYALFSRLAVELLTNEGLLAQLEASGARLSGNVEQVCGLRVAGPVVVPSTAPRLDAIIDAVRDSFLPRISDALNGLQRAVDTNTVVPLDTEYFPSCVEPPISLPTVDIDGSDLMASHAGLLALQGLIDLAGAYNVGFDLYDLVNSPIGSLLAQDSELLTLRSRDRLASARTAFDAALQESIAAVAQIRGEVDSQDDDLLVLMSEDDAETEQFLQLAVLVRQSLHGPVVIPAQSGLPASQRLNLSRLFNGELSSLRAFLCFDEDGDIDLRRFPDPTFGGIAPDLTQADIDQLIDGGRICAVCQTDDDCAGIGPRRAYCGFCYIDCTGEPMRCTGDGDAECVDGVFF